MANVVAVELSRSGVSVIEVSQAQTAAPTIQRFGTAALSEGAVFDGEVQHPAEVVNALKQLWRKHRFSTKQVVLGIGNRKLLVREATLPLMPGGYTHETLAFQVQDLISAPIEETVLDFLPLRDGMVEDPDSGRTTPGQEGLLIAAPKAGILSTAAVFTKAGLTISHADLSALAISRAIAPQAGLGTTAILNIGANTTHVVIVTDGVVQFVRVIPNGGDDVSRALEQLQDLSFAKADALKTRLGLFAVQGDQKEIEAENSIRENVSAMIGNVQNTIGYYTSRHPDRRLQRLVLSGGGSRLGGLASVLQHSLQVPVEYADPFAGFGFASRVDEQLIRSMGPELVAAVGLAIGGGKR